MAAQEDEEEPQAPGTRSCRRQLLGSVAAGAPVAQRHLLGHLVFTTPLGTNRDPRNFNQSFASRCDKAGVRRIQVHDTRHTCVSLLTALDVHPRVAMAITALTVAELLQSGCDRNAPAVRALREELRRRAGRSRLRG